MANKEKIRLLKQALKLFEEEPEPSKLKIVTTVLIQESDVGTFTQNICTKAEELEGKGIAVSVQYSTALASSPAGQMLIHSALLIGRK